MITHNLGVIRLPPKAYNIIEVQWNHPPSVWIKCNIDGSALGVLGFSGCGGVFRTCKGFVKGCFAYGLGIGFAFKAEIMSFILAVEKAKEFGWVNLWVESDSLYVVNLFRDKSNKIPWKFKNRWMRALSFASQIRVVVSHIYREGNAVADKLANTAANSQASTWWFHMPENLGPFVYRDLARLPNYRFSN